MSKNEIFWEQFTPDPNFIEGIKQFLKIRDMQIPKQVTGVRSGNLPIRNLTSCPNHCWTKHYKSVVQLFVHGLASPIFVGLYNA